MKEQELIHTANRRTFNAIDPSTGLPLPGEFFCATQQDIAQCMQLAAEAFPVYSRIGKDKKAAFIRAIAANIEDLGETLIERAAAESGLPVARLQGERGRTCSQLLMFASYVEEGSWVEAVIDSSLPDRLPLPRPDLRKMLVPIGPVVVFGASNFPLAFSVAGGDTASALAAGCPVIVKAHPAHPGTSQLVAGAILKAAKQSNMPDGVFSILYDDGFDVGAALVKHEQTKAVTFTGSLQGGLALQNIAQQRDAPIPVFAEMGSINPVVLLPGILQQQAENVAKQYAASITLGAGQFCTNPGLLLAVQSPGLSQFENTLASEIGNVQPATMLTPGISQNYTARAQQMAHENGAEILAKSNHAAGVNQAQAVLAKVSAEKFISNPAFQREVFGPYSLLVVADNNRQLEKVVQKLEGQLTVTIMSTAEELLQYKKLIDQLSAITGRIILNGVPTGVEVCAAMQHGGPYPATSDSRFTSVGTAAVRRFVRPLSWQNWHPELLPEELKDGNPLQIWRMVNQQWTKD